MIASWSSPEQRLNNGRWDNLFNVNLVRDCSVRRIFSVAVGTSF